jgi:hypothetical protein
MEKATKALSLMNFKGNYDLTSVQQLFQDELNWLASKTGNLPAEALFVSYAYAGTDYSSFFLKLSDLFNKSGIKLVDITSADPAALIASARLFVIGGGDIQKFVNSMNKLVTSTYNPYQAIKSRIDAGIGYLGWNEGSAVVSPAYFSPPALPLPVGIGGSPFQIVTNFKDTDPNCRPSILNYLKGHPSVKTLIAQVDSQLKDGTSVRLEDTGAGMIDGATAPFPIVVKFKIVDGVLVEF